MSQAEISVAQARSGGNPRVLGYLLKAGRGLLDPSEINNEIELDDLIQKRITDALGAALKRGYEEKDVNAFLAGLAVLPPPVPLDEYAGAHGIDISAIESFASDLSPLLERTSHGLMFRDEPRNIGSPAIRYVTGGPQACCRQPSRPAGDIRLRGPLAAGTPART